MNDRPIHPYRRHPSARTAAVMALAAPMFLATAAVAQVADGMTTRSEIPPTTSPGAQMQRPDMSPQDAPAARSSDAGNVAADTARSPGIRPDTVTGDVSRGSAVDATGSDTEVLASIDRATVLEGRQGGGQRDIALMQTTLLNRFSQLGFADVREFRRDGDTYVAEAQTTAGDWLTVTLDPATGRIVSRRQ